MPLAFSLLSGSQGGQNITIAATTSTGTTIHATGTSASVAHRIYLYASNSSTSDVLFTVEWGGTSTGDLIKQTIPAQSGTVPIVENWPLVGTGSVARTVRGYAATTNVINVNGWANTYST